MSWSTSLLECPLAWPGHLGVSYWDYPCPAPAAGCKHSGEVAPPPGCHEKRPQGSRQWAFRHLSVHQVLRETTYFCPQGLSCEGCHLSKGGSSSGSPTLSPTHLSSCPCWIQVWGGRSRAPGFQADTWPWPLPYHTPWSHSNPE